MDDDLYEILGVLPSAEDIVITAAYRVLAQRYHPDRWTGPPGDAHDRMAAINRSYATLKDPARRAAYDNQRAHKARASFERQRYQWREAVFAAAITELEVRWSTATAVFPDLMSLRARLAVFSSALAFAYVTVILEKKNFNDRKLLADYLQDMFLERYFGTNASIKGVAHDLILSGKRDAAKSLNELVDVMGSEVDANRLIAVLNDRHGHELQTSRSLSLGRTAMGMHRSAFVEKPCLANLIPLCEASGFAIREKSQGLFRDTHYVVTPPGKLSLTFNSAKDFVSWGLNEFK